LGDIAEVSGGITKNPKRLPKKNAFPFLRVANVMRDRLDLREVHKIEVFPGELERLRLRRGDLLVVEGNGSPDQIGRSALWDGSIDPCVHQNHLIRVRPGVQILSQYLNIFWNAPSSMATIQAAASSTTGLHTLSTGKVRGMKVIVPPIRTQYQIVEEVDRRVSALGALDQYLGNAQTRGSTLRSAILAAAFSGNLVPQDLSDEPAVLLLDRITSERASLDGEKRIRTRKPRTPREKATA
jgi:type I restriction enzyme S subunit